MKTILTLCMIVAVGAGCVTTRTTSKLTINGGTYEGEVKDGKPHGKGTLSKPDGASQSGFWWECSYVGAATFTEEQGTYTNTHGSMYVGEWKDGKEDGYGTWVNAIGDKYVGEWKDGLPNGQGTYTNICGWNYVGEWKDGKMHGHGTETASNGQEYVGEWKNGQYHGQGSLTWPGGEKYVGKFKDGQYHRKGTLTRPDGTTQSGLWKKGLYVGPALAMDSNAPVGVVIATNGQTRIVGTLIFDNGTYEGEIKDGMANGHGTWMNTNGFKYVGEFEDDERYGQGMVTTLKPMDEWADCNPHGQGRLTAPDGTKQSGLRKDDRNLDPAPAQTNTPPASGTDKKP